MDILSNTEIKGLPVRIQCTWANAFLNPEWNKPECIISYDRVMLKKSGAGIDNIIGTLTGNYTTDADGLLWLEAELKYSNRRPTGWFRESDIWYDLKGTLINPLDSPRDEQKDNPWLAWVTGGLTLFKLLS